LDNLTPGQSWNFFTLAFFIQTRSLTRAQETGAIRSPLFKQEFIFSYLS
jgi:hypothetical protein